MVTQTAAQAGSNSSPREEKFRSRLWELYYKFLNPHLAEEVWNRCLTDEERTRLGSLDSAFKMQDSTLGFYAKAKNTSREVAVIELSRLYGLAEIDYIWLCQELLHFTGEQIGPLASEVAAVSDKPNWDSDRNELWIQGMLARKVRRGSVPCNIRLILDSFQKKGWPARIEDPLTDVPDPERLRSTIASLNGGNKKIKHMKFFSDGTGKGITWEPFSTSTDTESRASE